MDNKINSDFRAALAALKKGVLPSSFTNWSLANKAKDSKSQDGGPDHLRTIAHHAAELGKLPPTFDQWDLKTAQGVTVEHTAAFYGNLPETFPVERLSNELNDGETLAHLAAKKGCLPKTFDNLELRNRAGETVYHKLAEAGAIPEGFKKWGVDGPFGTVAHQAARSLKLPRDFDGWDAAGKNDKETVPDAFVRHLNYAFGKDYPSIAASRKGVFPDNIPEDVLWRRLSNGLTVAHLAAAHVEIGEDYKGWADTRDSSKGSAIFFSRGTVAHVAAAHGNLPANFQQWELDDGSGETVLHNLARSAETIAKNYRIPLEQWSAKNSQGETPLDLARNNSRRAGELLELHARSQADHLSDSIIGAPSSAAPLTYKEAFQALKDGTLPDDFKDWGMRNEAGWTIAHHAASICKLPADFKDWRMEGAKPGFTVAHIAMCEGALPPTFNDWDIKDASGKTLGEVAVKHPKLGQEYQARIEAAKPSSEAQAQGGKNNQVAPVETSSTGRITGGGRFNRPPDLSNREPEPERRPIKAFISRGM